MQMSKELEGEKEEGNKWKEKWSEWEQKQAKKVVKRKEEAAN